MKKKNFRKTNPAFHICLLVLILLLLFSCFVWFFLQHSYGEFYITPISSNIKYKEGYEPADKLYDDEGKLLPNENLPELVYEDGKVIMHENGCQDTHITYIYTGDLKFTEPALSYWDELVAEGKKYPEVNGEDGFKIFYSNNVELNRDGWYTVLGIWYEDSIKYCVYENFNRSAENPEETTEGKTNPLEFQTLKDTWEKNKVRTMATKGIQNYLLLDGEKWEDVKGKDTYPEKIVLETVNHTTKTRTRTTISKEMAVYIPEIGNGRVKDAYNFGGIELLIKTLEENLGVNIQNYALFKNDTLLTMGLSYKEYKEYVSQKGNVKKYEVREISIPEENEESEFFEENPTGKIVSPDEIEKKISLSQTLGNDRKEPAGMLDVLKMLLIALILLDLLAMAYLTFIHRYQVIYITSNGEFKKEKKYKFNKVVHVYHQKAVSGKIEGMYVDPEMEYAYSEEIRMPMRNLKVYVKCKENQ